MNKYLVFNFLSLRYKIINTYAEEKFNVNGYRFG